MAELWPAKLSTVAAAIAVMIDFMVKRPSLLLAGGLKKGRRIPPDSLYAINTRELGLLCVDWYLTTHVPQPEILTDQAGFQASDFY